METTQLSREEQLIAFFINACDGKIGRTQLMKFLYLTDYEARRYLGRPLSNLDYIWHHYGPYDAAVGEVVKGLTDQAIIQEHTVVYPTGQVGYRYYWGGKPITYDFLPIELQILGYIYRTYSKMNLRALLDDVVYETEPMQQARELGAKQEGLNMSMVDGTKRVCYGISFEELFDRIQRVRAGEFRTHAEVMRDLRVPAADAAA
jgi:hypothetical protein